jgi:DNA mismatch repair ATPase MutL
VNGRCVDNDLISGAVDAVYEEYYGKKGADYILYIGIPPEMVDVNTIRQKKGAIFERIADQAFDQAGDTRLSEEQFV